MKESDIMKNFRYNNKIILLFLTLCLYVYTVVDSGAQQVADTAFVFQVIRPAHKQGEGPVIYID